MRNKAVSEDHSHSLVKLKQILVTLHHKVSLVNINILVTATETTINIVEVIFVFCFLEEKRHVKKSLKCYVYLRMTNLNGYLSPVCR